MSFACKRFSQLCHHPASWFMKPNEFKDHSRFGLSLRRSAVCRCTGSCRWVHFLLLAIYVALSKFSSALHQCVWRRPRPSVPWLGGHTAAITSMLVRGYNPEQPWHPWTTPWQASLGLYLLPSLSYSAIVSSLYWWASFFFPHLSF